MVRNDMLLCVSCNKDAVSLFRVLKLRMQRLEFLLTFLSFSTRRTQIVIIFLMIEWQLLLFTLPTLRR